MTTVPGASLARPTTQWTFHELPARAVHLERRVALIWGLLMLNVLGSPVMPMVVHLPSTAEKMLTQGALLAALVLALTINPRVRVRPSLFLVLCSVLALTSLMASVRFVSIGTDYRAIRLLLFVVVLWLLTPWWGRADLTMLRVHLRILLVVVGSVVIGAVVAFHTAFATQGRLSGDLWPIPSTQVAHYAAVAVGIAVLAWMSGLVDRRWAVGIAAPCLAVLLLTHTRTALVTMCVGLLVGALSLVTTRRRARRVLVLTAVLAAVAALAFAPELTAWLSRGQSSQQLSELTGRTKAWSLVLADHRPETNKILGSGISDESIQGLAIDDTWLATYLDQGLIGDALVGSFLLVLMVSAVLRARGPPTAIAIFLIVYCMLASVTETGLGGATPYLLDLTVAASLLALPAPSTGSSPAPTQ